MGQKVNPHGLRVGVIKDWDSKWYAEKDFADYLVEDHEIRTYLKKRLYSCLLYTSDAADDLRRDYTALVFPRSRSKEHLIALRLQFIQLNRVLLSVKAELRSRK